MEDYELAQARLRGDIDIRPKGENDFVRGSSEIRLTPEQELRLARAGEVRESGVCPNHLAFLASCLKDGYWPLKLMPNNKQRTKSLFWMETT